MIKQCLSLPNNTSLLRCSKPTLTSVPNTHVPFVYRRVVYSDEYFSLLYMCSFCHFLSLFISINIWDAYISVFSIQST